MKKKILAAALSCSLLLSMPLQVNAATSETATLNAKPGTEAEIQAAGLISSYSLSISSKGAKKMHITAKTYGTEVLAKLGLKGVKVEYSSNGVNNWKEEKDLGDKLKENVATYSFSEDVTVAGGYYYRVTLTHYAKEDKLLFPTTQSVSNVSNVIWVSKT